jgi:hypothetical protein
LGLTSVNISEMTQNIAVKSTNFIEGTNTMSDKKAYSPMKISELGSLTEMTQNSNMGYVQDGIQMNTMQSAGMSNDMNAMGTMM